jgi:hypothetical protein
MKLILAVPDSAQKAFSVQSLEDPVDGYLGDYALSSYIVESGIDHVIFISRMQQPEEDVQ